MGIVGKILLTEEFLMFTGITGVGGEFPLDDDFNFFYYY